MMLRALVYNFFWDTGVSLITEVRKCKQFKDVYVIVDIAGEICNNSENVSENYL